jgi:hypothetical protein
LAASAISTGRDIRVVAGVMSYIFSSAIVALIATVFLSAEDYTIFMAYTSVIGVVLLGPTAAVEQHATLLTLRHRNTPSDLFKSLLFPCLGLSVCMISAIYVPFQDWQSNAFGPRKSAVQLVMVAAIPILLFSTIVRGRANGAAAIRHVGNSHFLFGIATILISMISWLLGIDLLIAIFLGQLVGWLAPGVYLVAQRVKQPTEMTVLSASSGIASQSVLLVVSNLLLLANILATQFIYRLHSDVLGTETVAEAQLMISISCLSCALALGLAPTLIQEARRVGVPAFFWRPVTLLVLGGGLAIPLLTVVIGQPASRILLDGDSTLSTLEIAAIASGATTLVLAMVMGVVLIALESLVVSISSWAASLFLLFLSIEILNDKSYSHLPTSIAIGTAGGALVMFFVTLWSVSADE